MRERLLHKWQIKNKTVSNLFNAAFVSFILHPHLASKSALGAAVRKPSDWCSESIQGRRANGKSHSRAVNGKKDEIDTKTDWSGLSTVI